MINEAVFRQIYFKIWCYYIWMKTGEHSYLFIRCSEFNNRPSNIQINQIKQTQMKQFNTEFWKFLYQFSPYEFIQPMTKHLIFILFEFSDVYFRIPYVNRSVHFVIDFPLFVSNRHRNDLVRGKFTKVKKITKN